MGWWAAWLKFRFKVWGDVLGRWLGSGCGFWVVASGCEGLRFWVVASGCWAQGLRLMVGLMVFRVWGLGCKG